MLNIIIVGRGAIGSLLATKLCSEHRVSFVTSSPTADVSFTLTSKTGLSGLYRFDFASDKTLLAADVIISCVKSYQVDTALKPLIEKLKVNNKKPPILLCHNGMGSAEKLLANTQTKSPLFALLTTHGCLKRTANHFVHTGLGQFDIGPITERIDDILIHNLKKSLCDIYQDFNWQQNIIEKQWLKLAVNCVINPVTALFNVNNGALAQAQYQPMINCVLEEIVSVANRLGISFTLEHLKTVVNNVITATAANYSSMHQDIMHKRKTEIEYINGYIVNKGKELGVETPENKKLLERVLTLSN